MLKKVEIVKVTKITDKDGVYYYHDDLFLGGYDKNGMFLSPGHTAKMPADKDPEARVHVGGVVRPPKPEDYRREQEHEAGREISSLQDRIDRAKGEK